MMGIQTMIEKSFKTAKGNPEKGSGKSSQKGGSGQPSQGK